ncbi:MAG TPA: transcription antitermination factor NusB [Candidatus Kapabacteria bacterium]|nr:transcription antitermination factor NusB [Candidatus Kapabacteria bacterium]
MKSAPKKDHQTVSSKDHIESPAPKIETDEIFENDIERDKKLPRRRLARERVMQMLYARALNGSDVDKLFREMVVNDIGDDALALEFAKELTFQLTSHEEETKKLITERLRHWDFSRIALIDRILIEIGITELRYFPEIPPKATINELIEIAKDFSTDDSGKFINGILHAVMTQLSEEGDLNKTGRGLIDRTL